jgi:hypothetical protein
MTDHRQTMQAFDNWNAVLSEKWHVDVIITDDQQNELSTMLYTIGVAEMNACIDIVANANEPSRTVRYLIGVIKNRTNEQPRRASGPVKTKQQTAGAYIYHRCAKCLFINRVRRDLMEQHRGKTMRCGGVECNQQWRVDDILKGQSDVAN